MRKPYYHFTKNIKCLGCFQKAYLLWQTVLPKIFSKRNKKDWVMGSIRMQAIGIFKQKATNTLLGV